MSNARIRIQKSPIDTEEAVVRIIISTEDKVATVVMPICNFAQAVMGVAGIDCEFSEVLKEKVQIKEVRE